MYHSRCAIHFRSLHPSLLFQSSSRGVWDLPLPFLFFSIQSGMGYLHFSSTTTPSVGPKILQSTALHLRAEFASSLFTREAIPLVASPLLYASRLLIFLRMPSVMDLMCAIAEVVAAFIVLVTLNGTIQPFPFLRQFVLARVHEAAEGWENEKLRRQVES